MASVLEAFALPPAARVDRRIPKTALIDHGATRKPDARLVETGIARLDWLAELSPATIAIPARADPPAPAVNILCLTPHGPAPLRLLELIHRAIPAPILLLIADDAPRLSLAPRRLGEDRRTLVTEAVILSPPLPAPDGFLRSLPLSGLPQADIGALYDGLVVRVEAWIAASISGTPFRLPLSLAEAVARRQALAQWRLADTAWQEAARAARREKRLGHAVALGEVARQKRLALQALVGGLA